MSQKANNLIDRLKAELFIKKDKDLCMLLGIKHNTLSTWKKRDTLDFNKILELCEKHDLDLNYIFFEEEESLKEEKKQAIIASALVIPEVHTNRKNKLNPFFNTQLVNTNRHISIFYNQVGNDDKNISGKLIVGQKVSSKKIVENDLYVIEDNNGKFYLDKLISIEEPTLKMPIFHLSDSNKNIDLKSIINLWQVLHISTSVQNFIAGLNPI